jgi:hypothetical protein
MTRVLKSNYDIAELRFPALAVTDETGRPQQDDDGNPRIALPEVVLPKSMYTRAERARGKVRYVELDDAQQARLGADQMFRRMLGKKHGFEWTPWTRIPISELPHDQRLAAERLQLQQENARLRSELRKHGLEVPTFNAPPVAEPVTVPSAEALASVDVSIPDDPAEPGALDVPGTRMVGEVAERAPGLVETVPAELSGAQPDSLRMRTE